MRKPDPTEGAMAALAGVHDAAGLAPFLRHRSRAVVARAAKRASSLRGADLVPALVEAFRQVLGENGAKDPGAEALLEIAQALVEMDAPVGEVFGAGIRYRQLDKSYGGPVEVAGPLRAVCIVGLVRMGDPEALVEATDLLLDSSPAARTGAVRALAESGRPEAELVLRLKARTGDEKGEVLGECFSALLRLAPRGRNVELVASHLASDDEERAGMAALALGESHLAQALPLLAEALGRSAGPSRQGALLTAIALLRTDEAVEFLLKQIESARERTAALALEVLASYRSDEAIRERAARAKTARASEILESVWRRYWP